jgi:threonine dehydrogenase-like Zn-dependent dehydrogenase
VTSAWPHLGYPYACLRTPRDRCSKTLLLSVILSIGVRISGNPRSSSTPPSPLTPSLQAVLGWDFAGEVVRLGYSARRFKAGDRVFGYARRPVYKNGTFATYIRSGSAGAWGHP